MSAPTTLRLAYTLAFVPHSQRVILLPRHLDGTDSLTEQEVRALRSRLHPLDTAIVKELLSTTVFGQLTDTQLARLLPVLAQRRTRVGEARLDIRELELLPRMHIEPSGRGVSLSLWLQRGERADPADREAGFAASRGRLLLGAQGFFLLGAIAYPVRSRAPQHLAAFSYGPEVELFGERLGAAARDTLVRDLTAAGVPEADLDELMVHRGPPSRYVVRFVHVAWEAEPQLHCTLEAHYAQGVVQLGAGRNDSQIIAGSSELPEGGEAAAAANEPVAETGALALLGDAPDRSASAPEPATDEGAEADADAGEAAAVPGQAVGAPEGEPSSAVGDEDADADELADEDELDGDAALGGAGSITERDLEAEGEAIRAMRMLGFRYERAHGAFAASGELALRALDPALSLFDAAWTVLRGPQQPTFHRDLQFGTHAKMLEDRGLIDLSVQIRAVSGEGTEAEATVEALVGMQELLAWLHSGQRYVRLADGSYAAPSSRFRQGLRILHDLGADSSRALISPLCAGLLRAMGDVAALCTVDAATQALMDELMKADAPEEVPVPEGLQVSMRDYQRRGLDWLMMLHRHRLTGILADDMGLGKTLQTLALLLTVKAREGQKPSLVVAPTSVVTVWRDEAQRFAPSLDVRLWYGSPQERAQMDIRDADLVVTSYGVLRRDAERLGTWGFRYVILDEAQSTKNARSLGAHAIRQLRSERRLALSGTPLENRPEELWSIFDFLAPGFLWSLRKFRRVYALPIARGDRDAMALLRMKIEPLILRRLKKEVAKELPDKVESTLRCEMEPAQRALYDHVAGELKESIKEKIAQVGIEQAQLDILAALTRLRQICCDPALLPTPAGTRVPPSAKLQLFEELMREALASERCVVVFSQFVQMQRRLIEVIKRLGVDPLWLHGGTTHRDKVVAAFQDPKGPPVIVVSLKAGGTGLTLTRADTVMHYDPWWNPAVERQATDRAHRLGQTNVVTVYRLVCARSIEERVLRMAEGKEALAHDLLGSEGGAASKRISREEIFALLS